MNKRPRHSKTKLITPTEVVALDSRSPTEKNPPPTISRSSTLNTTPAPVSEPVKSTAVNTSTNMNRRSPLESETTGRCTKFSVKPNTVDRPTGSKRQTSKKRLDTGEFVDKTQNDKLESALAIHLSDIKAQTSNATGEERDKGPARQLHGVKFAATPLPRTERVVKQQSVHHSLATSSGKESSLDCGLKLDRYSCYVPNPIAPAVQPWRGKFNIRHYDNGISIDAYPSYKCGNWSKELPDELVFDLLPRSNIWGNLFKDGVCSVLDIDLYFLFSETATLPDYIYERDMLLRTQIDKQELLLFSSKHLPKDSQILFEQFYLWGIFRSLRNNTAGFGGESGEHSDINLAGDHEEGTKDINNAGPSIQGVPKTAKDVGSHRRVQAVPKHTKSTIREPTTHVQPVRKPAATMQTVVPKPTKKAILEAVPKSAKDTTIVKKECRDETNPVRRLKNNTAGLGGESGEVKTQKRR